MTTKTTISGQDLKGKTVQLRGTFFKQGFRAEDHLFVCESGFGCDPNMSGTAIYGTFLSDGEIARVDRHQVEFVVEENTATNSLENEAENSVTDQAGIEQTAIKETKKSVSVALKVNIDLGGNVLQLAGKKLTLDEAIEFLQLMKTRYETKGE